MKKENCNGKIIIKISIIWIFILAIIIAFLIAFFRNYILATNETSSDAQLDEEEIVEANENTVDILKLMVENNYSNEKLVNEERDIEYEIEKQEDNQIPKGEEVRIRIQIKNFRKIYLI